MRVRTLAVGLAAALALTGCRSEPREAVGLDAPLEPVPQLRQDAELEGWRQLRIIHQDVIEGDRVALGVYFGDEDFGGAGVEGPAECHRLVRVGSIRGGGAGGCAKVGATGAAPEFTWYGDDPLRIFASVAGSPSFVDITFVDGTVERHPTIVPGEPFTRSFVYVQLGQPVDNVTEIVAVEP